MKQKFSYCFELSKFLCFYEQHLNYKKFTNLNMYKTDSV